MTYFKDRSGWGGERERETERERERERIAKIDKERERIAKIDIYTKSNEETDHPTGVTDGWTE